VLKILIADDEQPVLDGLQFLIKKHFDDMVVCAAARNGRDSMELVRLHQPDVVLMDVKMPGISGLDVIRDLRQSFPQMVFILVTAFERFEIAKEAIDLGIQDYLLKPLSREALIQVLQRARNTVKERQSAQRREIGNRDWREESTVFLEQALLFHAAAGSLSYKQSETLIRLLGLESSKVRIVTMEWTASEPSAAEAGFERFRETVKFKTHGCFGVWRGGRFSVLFPIQEDDTPWLRWTPQDIPEGIHWRGGIGTEVPIVQAGQSLEESLWALEEAGPRAWADWRPREAASAQASYPFGLEKALIRALSAGDPDQAAFLTGPFWTALESLPAESLGPSVLQLVVVAAHNRGMEEGLSEPLDRILAPFTGSEAARVPAVLKENLRQTLVRLARKRPTTAELSPVVEKAMDYLRKNFGKAVSLEETARYTGVHPQYLSRMFSQEKGESFVDYLTRLRVSKAKELLRGGQNVKETAAEVGYADANYFSRLFKKWEGLSPGDYAQEKRGSL
jgi:two-component system response regulator YesN